MEVDTSAETGIADWNYIDYARVYGSLELPSAALISGTRQLLYIPDENSNGADSFVYVATDCAGDLFRSSFPGIISFEIDPVARRISDHANKANDKFCGIKHSDMQDIMQIDEAKVKSYGRNTIAFCGAGASPMT